MRQAHTPQMKDTNPEVFSSDRGTSRGGLRNGSWSASLLIIGTLLLLLGCNLLAGDYFPLEKGNYWVYRGETKFLVKNPATEKNEPKTEVLTWKMEVVDTAERQLLFAALIKGAPYDLSWYEPGKTRGDYLIVRVGTATYYLLSGEAALAAWAKIKDETNNLEDLGGELFLDAPLMDGKVFGGDFANLARGRYCWVVQSERSFDPHRFPVAGKIANPVNYTLRYSTNPDHQIVDFVPSIGIVGFQYVHHGTLSETDLGLIEFGKSKAGR